MRLVSVFLLKAKVINFVSFGRNVINVLKGIGFNYYICVRCICINPSRQLWVWAFSSLKRGLGVSSQIIFGFMNLDVIDVEMLSFNII